MVLWHRVARLSKRLQVAGASSTETNARWTSKPQHLHHLLLLPHRNPSFVYAPTRSFAVPAKFKRKPIAEASGPRLNEAITASHVRLVTEEGHRVVPRKEALDRAGRLNLDLVEVQRNGDPPVCKIMDFHKQNFKRKLAKSSKSAIVLRRSGKCKEVQINLKTEPKDLKMKADMITRLMERGYRVKCIAVPFNLHKPRPKDETTYVGKVDLEGLLKSLLILLQEDVAILESGPHVVDRVQAYAILRHVQFGTKKLGKKAVKVSEALRRPQCIQCASSHAESKIFDQRDEQVTDANWGSSQSGLEAATDHSKPLHQKLSPEYEAMVFLVRQRVLPPGLKAVSKL